MASITIWNRVEPRARSQDMKAGLEARVHDPLWLLTRQWQVGEFEGRDAGSPVMADITSTATVFDRYSIGAEPARTYDGRAPLEVLVEREKIRPLQAGADLRQAAEAGLQFCRMLDAADLGRLKPTYLRQYPLQTNALDPDSQALYGAAIEDVLLLRDESANMAWGVERLAMGPAGAPVDRALAWKTTTPPAQPPAIGALPSYRLGSTVPSYWFPFVPVAVGTGPLRMRRGRLPVGDAAPMGRMLGYSGLTIFLEELPREGVHLERRYRAARGPDGSTHVWIGRRRSTGSGEGRSGLRFDYLE